ncbi:topoisomerase DNA-binding C4 zinc finger domain-containing protein [Halomicrococcus gelatinilyticus]|uniref:topoisomerase DNA-binding C4 zinc finger domain-containing protein n=1 Tax=Halomicrococcus gelatinilyticus TaxID=1702103 RepID=UPI002E0D398C
MSDTLRVFAGDCTITFDEDSRRRRRGEVVALLKPDDTLLVHDVDGYQPVAWLTRAETARATVEDGTFTLTATTSDRRVRVECHTCHDVSRYPGSVAGIPVGDCPDCEGPLVRADGDVTCLGCAATYPIPRRATVREETCDCDLPEMRVERGDPFDVCVDRDCDPLVDAVRERFDREWACPDCGADLRILERGGIVAGCDRYPDCETALGIPDGLVVGECDCGLPVFETRTGRRCLDADCDAERHQIPERG